MSKFYNDNRMYMIYGNHDKQKEEKRFSENKLNEYYCETNKKTCPLFPKIDVYEGIILENQDNKDYKIFLVHGHQGDLINDRLYKLGRFLVRYLWRTVEIWGVNDPTAAGRNYKKKNRVERKLRDWADKENKMLIAGHTHRPTLPDVGEAMYFNDGSCVHPRCITAIEIEKGCISLVKWSVMTREDRSMYVEREVLEGPVKLEDYFESNKVSYET